MKKFIFYGITWIIVGAIEFFIVQNGWQVHFFLVLSPLFFGLLVTDAIRMHYQEKDKAKQ